MICSKCQKPITGQYLRYEGENYHKGCLTKVLPNQCDVCGEGILGTYIIDSWGHKAHAQHPGPCSSCGRVLSKKTSKGGFGYDDGRFICGFCRKTAVSHSWTVNKCKREILKQLVSVGFKQIPLNVPISLVSQNELTRKSNSLHTKGVAVFQKEFKNNKVHAIKHHIYILHGIPKIEFKGILAHELVHVWQNENEFKMSPRHTEGLCNLASYWIYQQDGSELAHRLMENLVKSEDPVYGQGFRLMLKRWEKLGWRKFVEEILTQKEGIERSLWKKIFG